MNFAEMVVPLKLAGQTYDLYFNANTMGAYEEATGKMFLETVSILYDVIEVARKSALAAKVAGLATASVAVLDGQKSTAAEEKADAEVPMVSAFDIVRRVPRKDLQALIWAALHVYGKNPADPDEPSWPMTLGKVGRMIQLQDVPRIFSAFLRGQIKNSPSVEEMGESQARSVTANGEEIVLRQNVAVSGGERSINLPADAFA